MKSSQLLKYLPVREKLRFITHIGNISHHSRSSKIWTTEYVKLGCDCWCSGSCCCVQPSARRALSGHLPVHGHIPAEVASDRARWLSTVTRAVSTIARSVRRRFSSSRRRDRFVARRSWTGCSTRVNLHVLPLFYRRWAFRLLSARQSGSSWLDDRSKFRKLRFHNKFLRKQVLADFLTMLNTHRFGRFMKFFPLSKVLTYLHRFHLDLKY